MTDDVDEIIGALEAAVGAENVRSGEHVKDDESHDEALTATPVRPVAVVTPTSADQVAAVLVACTAAAVPVTARGSGSGLSGACIPVEGGIVVSFERMDQILEIDVDNQLAVVQPGVQLDELDAALAPHGLAYPVYPGEYSATLGGNVNTNAGGMRAVKYGVTRQHVLGLEAVLATGEVMRTGGRIVKASTGYDLTQLIIGSEGTLALVTEITLRLSPRPAHSATVLAPFPTLDDVAAAVPKVAASGLGPAVLEYIDMLTLSAMQAQFGLELGIPEEIQSTALAYLVVAMESTHTERLDEDVQAVSELLASLGAIDVYVLPPGAAKELIEAREKAFWVAKANNADDIVDIAVPRRAIPEFMAKVSEIASANGAWIAGCGHAGDGNVHLAVFQQDPEIRSTVMMDLFRTSMDLGGVISGEHGIGTEKKKYFLALEDPAKVALMRRVKAAFDPAGILNPGTMFDLEDPRVNGAQALLRTLVDSGVDTCFMNPGTSEMHFVAALDSVPEIRGVLGLFEGVATGAAAGYARMAGKPAAVLLHLGPGLGNGLANLHNARKGFVPIVNIVGDHATYHKQYDAQLESDIETVARNVSSWIRTSASTAALPGDAAEAVAAAMGPPGQVATLILPADVSWTEGASPAAAVAPTGAAAVDASHVEDIAKVLRSGEPTCLFLGGTSLGERGVRATARIAAATGVKVLAETFPTRVERGGGLPEVERLAYLAEFAAMQLDGLSHLVLVDAKAPVSFFAYPEKASYLVPDGCQVHELAGRADAAEAALEALADALDAPADAPGHAGARPERPTGALTAMAIADAVGALLPEGAIVSDEAQTSGLFTPAATAGGPRHSWLCLTGGAIGQGLPTATGAAVACPDRPVLALEADGSALYTIQSLWTQAREGLDVTTLIYNNRSYSVLNMELGRVGAEGGGPAAQAMLDLHRPDIDFVQIAQGLGVPATRAETADELVTQLEAALATPGPSLIDAIVPPIL